MFAVSDCDASDGAFQQSSVIRTSSFKPRKCRRSTVGHGFKRQICERLTTVRHVGYAHEGEGEGEDDQCLGTALVD